MMWISYYVYIWDLNAVDRLINIIVSHLKEHKITNYFFIRYWEGGPHIRIRVKYNKSISPKFIYKILSLSTQEFFSKNPMSSTVRLDKNEFYKKSFTDGKNINVDDYPWYKNGEIVKSKYIPEIDRYGGVKMIEKSEESFIYSSDLVASILKFEPSFGNKISFLFAIFNYLIENIFQNDIDNKLLFLNNSKQFWMNSGIKVQSSITNTHLWQQLEAIVNKLCSFPTLNVFLNSLMVIYESNELSLKYRRAIIFSHFHMLANRLGVPISYELLFYQLKLERMEFLND